MSLLKLLSKRLDRWVYTTPSHGQKNPLQNPLTNNLEGFYNWDVSEFDGYDNLSHPKGAILMAQGKASDIYDTQKTFFLTQGSTTGILAVMKTLIKPNDKVLVSRNCHKSVYSGLILTSANVDWLMPDTTSDLANKWGVMGAVDVKVLEDTLKLNQYKMFIMTSPTYEGINSDIEAISAVCKQYGVYLFVDEAHGSLYNFSDFFPKTAIEQGADFSVNSLHKTAGALNQCSLLHVSKDVKGVEWREVQNAINLFHTSSPSYPLIANIEACINFLHSDKGTKAIDELVIGILSLQKALKEEGVEFLNNEEADVTKLVLKIEGVSGIKLSEFLFDNYSIEDEMANDLSLLFLTGIGTSRQKLEKLRWSLSKIVNTQADKLKSDTELKADFQPFPLVKIQPFEAFNKDYLFKNKEDALLSITSEMLVPYPPGCGILYPGEVVQQWHLKYLADDVKVMKK